VRSNFDLTCWSARRFPTRDFKCRISLLFEMRRYTQPVPETEEAAVQAEQEIRLAAEWNTVDSVAEAHALAKSCHSSSDRNTGVGERFLSRGNRSCPILRCGGASQDC
jgi:hypothetical protein